MTGKIIKGIAGFYYVHDGSEIYECKAKGIFRKDHKKPLVGDEVEFSVISDREKTGNIEELLDRRSSLIRPEVANVDAIFLVFACTHPSPVYGMLDRYLIQIDDTGIPVHIVVNKTDLASEEDLQEIREYYRASGYPVRFISVESKAGIEELKKELRGKTTVFAGPSGVGKSSLMNLLLEDKVMETGALSERIERGKQTTRHSEIFCLGNEAYVCDTPGFSSVDITDVEPENLAYCFHEFLPYIPTCRFGTSCRHYKEQDCAVKDAVRNGVIPRSRYRSYREIYDELSKLRRY